MFLGHRIDCRNRCGRMDVKSEHACKREKCPGRIGSMIIGLGTDIVDVERIARMIANHGDHFLARVFTKAEIAHCQPRRDPAPHYAGRWAAKEAVMKVLGTGFTNEVGWTDIEVLVKPSGQPYIELHGTTLDVATRLGINEILVSISHTKNYATATAIGMATKTIDPK